MAPAPEQLKKTQNLEATSTGRAPVHSVCSYVFTYFAFLLGFISAIVFVSLPRAFFNILASGKSRDP